ncbi:MAG TPA: hypothetical protein VHG70_16810 [Nocardioidaceae bacterium]|nr:hypothetical protein [Nocardioidaceae bacterium]
MSTGVLGSGRARVQERTQRQDRWWVTPAITFAVLLAFVIYATWRALVGEFYYSKPYLSPFYSPCLSTECVPDASDFGQPISWFPLSPALLILIFPLGFRLTCYYYRKAYYRSFWLSPPSCAVAEPHKRYTGETRFPLLLQNLHRWFFFPAVLIAGVLTFDTILAFRDETGEWGHAGLGTLIMIANIVLLWGYTFGCHSCRHIVGGRLRTFSKHPVRYRMWGWVSKLNARHAMWAWLSLFSVALTDLYVYLLATGTISDPRFF